MCSQPITSYPCGSKVRIDTLEGASCAKSRLLAMGLTPGTLVEIEASGCGPCRLKCRGSDVVIGHGLASTILAVGEDDRG